MLKQFINPRKLKIQLFLSFFCLEDLFCLNYDKNIILFVFWTSLGYVSSWTILGYIMRLKLYFTTVLGFLKLMIHNLVCQVSIICCPM